MNINLQQILKVGLICCLLAMLPAWGNAQVGLQQQETGFMDMPLQFHLTSVNVKPTIITSPSQGEVLSIEEIDEAKGIWEVVYQPNPEYVGFDIITIQHHADYPPGIAVGLINTTFQLTIVPSLVEAQHDYGIVEEGETMSIQVVNNDSVSHGELSVNAVFPVVNHGKASLSDRQGFVDFKPETGFTGLADFNYVACDDIGTCATGSASIYVNPKGKIYDDEIRLGTGQNTDKPIPMPFKVTSTDLPENVKIEISQYAIVYEPAFDFVGQQTFTAFGEGGHQRTIVMDVIERPVNELTLATNDITYALLGEVATVDVMLNDNMNAVSRVDYYPLNGGTVEKVSESVINFTPNAGFSGVARIAYRAFDANFNSHWAYAYVVYNRDNFGPNDEDYAYEFAVSPGGTQAITYKAPIENYQLLPNQNTNAYGTLEAQSKGTLVYYAPEEPFADEFEILYCAPANAHPDDCQSIKVTMNVGIGARTTDCTADCVLPGDLNADGIVDKLDLLPLGLHIGEMGPARSEASTDFTPQAAPNWDMTFVEESTVNLKHYDANGDGILTDKDAQAILDNYGKVSHLVPFSPPALAKGLSINARRVKPSLEEIPLGAPIPAGTAIELEISLGEEGAQELDLYGFTFPFKMSGKSFIDPVSFKVEFEDDSWVALNSPTLTLEKEAPTNNVDLISLDFSFTRTSRQAVSGMGKLATVGFVVIEENVEGFKLPEAAIDFRIAIGEAYSIDGSGQHYAYGGTELSIPVTLEKEEVVELTPASIRLYPNPATDELRIQLPAHQSAAAVTIFNLAGSVMYQNNHIESAALRVPVAQLPQGLYIAQVQTTEGTVSRKFEVLK